MNKRIVVLLSLIIVGLIVIGGFFWLGSDEAIAPTEDTTEEIVEDQGICGDKICGPAEQEHPGLCPSDCKNRLN